MRILGLIPARGGSKGVPRKNIKLLNSKPLLQYTTQVALESKLLTKVILSSDDDEIIQIAKKIGIEVPFKRPELLANDTSPTLPVIQHALQFLKENKNEEFDAVCLLQVTTPFRTVGFLDEALRKFIESDTDSLISVQKVPHEYNPHWVFVKNDAGNLEIATGEKQIIARRQELPDTFHRDGSIYITKVEILLKGNSLYGDSISHIESPHESYVNIDTERDWEKAEELVKLIRL
ncbi:acylneuraminate cytidylyltransferase family protein [Aureibaculum sp. A20]|uniref:Acylneuraminate cytidylyltransferase family protein n=1 Tax=Aureibaculum flavum TaxID=2795986 RepID=A0ABS0WRH9_9FLAO|nr:acylneuraminate cytidylyltransferase family protein [Aureibaculum flavum]MBJ2174584.1 acylneuraminate cytidylyltransferase family protein [Aureibaculum flavum]